MKKLVESSAYAGMVIQLLISILLPIGLIIYWSRKGYFSWKAFFTGIAVFILFAQVLEAGLHTVMIDPAGPSLKVSDNPYLFALYGGLAAAVFEELGRYLAFLFVLKNSREFGDGVSLGIGHGGIEAVLIGAFGAVNAFIYATMVNAGTFETVFSALPADQVAAIKQQVIDTGFWLYALGAVERAAAIIIQITFSVIVLFGVKARKFQYVLYAIGLHLLVDFFVALYQVGIVTSIWLIEAWVIAFAGLSLFMLKKMKEKFRQT
ncbi:YhfC family intramembrane metalloprotease [Bacillus thermotolerans]|uniref:Membrane protein n=1 Tax=Bacillus thermotolerans TaxID=1221996 RepID=A0A0F5IB75_BACTR|nr:YhfC family intramembrane metalloprotease [Bacillus thermotolerans]KKB33423.1 Membrane protein [Bacillus thermotolerans]KKB37076.1 Membrane protein [Bacillus thermotolerans]KKB42854.1 Membrane protein [Bacillus thermotolerans]